MKQSSSISSQLSIASGPAGGAMSVNPTALNLGKLHVRLTNIGKSQDRLSSSLTYSRDAQKLCSSYSVVLPDYHYSILHHENLLMHPHRVLNMLCLIYRSRKLIWNSRIY